VSLAVRRECRNTGAQFFIIEWRGGGFGLSRITQDLLSKGSKEGGAATRTKCRYRFCFQSLSFPIQPLLAAIRCLIFVIRQI
jgi:hypothetical protein